MKFRRWSIAIFACVLTFSGLAAFKVLEIKQAIAFGESFPEHSETVETAQVSTVLYQKKIDVMGTVLAPKQLLITNELAGQIVTVGFRSGDIVEENQVLLALDVTTEKANLAAAEARAELAQSVYRRTRNLQKSSAVSQEELDRAKADLTSALAEIEVLNSTISKKTIKAPFNGRVGIHRFEVGQYLQSNSEITQLLGESNVLWVDFYVPQFYPELAVGAQIGVHSINAQRAKSSSEQTLVASILASDTVLNEMHRSRLYRASIDLAVEVNQAPLSHNASVEVVVPVSEPLSYFTVSTSAIQQDNLGEYVYVLSPDDKGQGYRAHRQQVNVSETVDGMVLIATNLVEGDTIATAGAFKLAEGMLTYTRERPSLANNTGVNDTAVNNTVASNTGVEEAH